VSGGVGLLGGTFDPVHCGHLEAARQVRERAGLEQVWLMPNALPPHRAELPEAGAEHRLAMVRLAVAGDPALGVCDVEVARGGRSYTIDSLAELERRHPGRSFALLLGYDVALGIRAWREPDRLLASTRIVVFNRAGAEPPSPARLRQLGFDLDRTLLIQIDSPPVSAHELRARLRQRQPVDGLVPATVAAYIREHRLYEGRVG
jgi:nicotinate-nucleotide adenylyltransferase